MSDSVHRLGLESGVVRLVAYDRQWPELFRAEEARLRAALAPLPIRLEHVGSTAIPGLAAKPVLDILGGYPSGAPVSDYIAALVRAGYLHRGEQGIPGREFFRLGTPRSHHLHLVEIDGTFWHDHRDFRDFLRRHDWARDAYAELKLRLGAAHPYDREAYIEGKTGFVMEIVRRAGEESKSRTSDRAADNPTG